MELRLNSIWKRRGGWNTLLVYWSLLPLLTTSTTTTTPLTPPPSPPVGQFQPLSPPPGFQTSPLSGYEVVGMGDFNNDKFTDLVLLEAKDRLKLKLGYYNEKGKKFQEVNEGWEVTSEYPIVNVVPGDWNFDGQLDILLMKRVNDKELVLSIHLGGPEGFDPKAISLPSSSDIQPIVVDFNGDMKPDLLGYRSENNKDPPKLTLWQNIATESTSISKSTEDVTLFEVKYLDPVTLLPTSGASNEPSETGAMCSWGSPHSNAFVDLDGDCLPDLFITCKDGGYQVWLNVKSQVPGQDPGRFVLSRHGELPKDAGPITFSDLRGEGSLDMIFPTCTSSGCTINLVENSQMPLCASISHIGEKCREQSQLCVSDPNFQFQFDKPGHTRLPVSELIKGTKFSKQPFLLSNMPSPSPSLIRPVPIRVGDFNIDGYPDLLVTISNYYKSDQYSDLSVVVLQSVPCTKDTCTGDLVRKRTYQLLPDPAQPKLKGATPIAGHFFDFHDDGTLDLLIVTWNQGKSLVEMTGFANKFHNDAYFLKAMVSSGACSRICPSGEPPYGSNQYGATIKVVVLDNENKFHVQQSVQLPQSSYYHFQTPYCHIGLGRVNNYFPALAVGSSRHNQLVPHRQWDDGVPNSQLVILPYQSPTTVTPHEWTRELFINPGQAALWVLLVLTSCMAILASIVAGLTWAEKREDEKERRRAIQHINFGSL